MKCLPVIFLLLFQEICAQRSAADSPIKYQYAIANTPYGDYFGVIVLRREGRSYRGEIVDEDGTITSMKVTKFDGHRLVFKSKIDGTNSRFRCEVFGDSIRGVGIFSGEDFVFVLKGKRVRD